MILAAPFTIMAQGFQVNLQGQAQQGMGGAGTGLLTDGASLFFNPGATSFLKGNEVNLGVTPTISHGQFLDKNTGIVANTKSPVGTPFAAYAAFELKDSSKLKLGLAVYTPFGSTVKWEDGWAGRFALTQLKLQAIFFQPTVSYKINDKVGVGLGFVVAKGSVNLQKDVPVVDNNGTYGHAELDGKAMGYGINFGLYYKPCSKFSVGLNYRSEVNMNIKKGTANFTVPTSLADKFPNTNFTASLPLPEVITLGLGYMPTDKLSFALDINHVNWESFTSLQFNYEQNTTSLIDTYSRRDYKDIFAFRFGGEYKVTEGLAVRLGAAYAPTPVKDGYMTPETPDANRINYTAGIGYTVKQKFGVNLSFYYTNLKREDINQETKMNGTYQTKVVAPGISLFYKF